MINLDYQSGMPIYEQIVEQIERYIAFGVYKPKEQLPSIREMASSLGINPNTVKKAYEELEKRGSIVILSTKGTFITDKASTVVNRIVEEKIAKIKENIKELTKLRGFQGRDYEKNLVKAGCFLAGGTFFATLRLT